MELGQGTSSLETYLRRLVLLETSLEHADCRYGERIGFPRPGRHFPDEVRHDHADAATGTLEFFQWGLLDQCREYLVAITIVLVPEDASGETFDSSGTEFIVGKPGTLPGLYVEVLAQ